MAKTVKQPKVVYYRGPYKYYASINDPNAIYYAYDVKKIIVDGVEYGLSDEQSTQIANSIINIEQDGLGFNWTTNDGQKGTIVFDISGNLASLQKEMKAYTDEQIAEVNKTISDLKSITPDDITYDSKDKSIYLKCGSTKIGVGFDATDFIKDGMLKNVEFIQDETQDLIQDLDSDGNPKVDSQGRPIYVKPTNDVLPYLKFTFNIQNWVGGEMIKESEEVIRISVVDLIDVYTEGDGLKIINNQINIDPDFIQSLGYNLANIKNASFQQDLDNSFAKTTYLQGETTEEGKNTHSIVSALIRLDSEIEKINQTNVGTVEVVHRDDSKYVKVQAKSTDTGSQYIIYENFDDIEEKIVWGELEFE